MTIRPDIELANASDPGCVRVENEDYYLFIEPEEEDQFQLRGRLVLVADGMGGYKGGRIASRLAGETIKSAFLAASEEDPISVLREGFDVAHRAIQAQAAEEVDLGQMGTTCTAIILRNRNLAFGHIGDSRLYLIRDGQAKQLSRDHTIVSNMIDEALISEEEALHHEKRHVLSAALGVGLFPEAEFVSYPGELSPGDILLLCSDGLHGLLSNEELASVTLDQSLEEACAELLAWARVRGGPDNVTLQLVRLTEAR